MVETIERIGFATVQVDNATAIRYNPVTWLDSVTEGGRNFKATPEGEFKEIYADGKVVYNRLSNAGYSISMQLIGALDDGLLGECYKKQKVTEGTGSTAKVKAYYETDKDSTNNVALLVVGRDVSENSTGYTLDIYFNCHLEQRPDKEMKTREGKFDPVFPELKFKSRPRKQDGVIVYTETFNTLPDALITTIPQIGSGIVEDEVQENGG